MSSSPSTNEGIPYRHSIDQVQKLADEVVEEINTFAMGISGNKELCLDDYNERWNDCDVICQVFMCRFLEKYNKYRVLHIDSTVLQYIFDKVSDNAKKIIQTEYIEFGNPTPYSIYTENELTETYNIIKNLNAKDRKTLYKQLHKQQKPVLLEFMLADFFCAYENFKDTPKHNIEAHFADVITSVIEYVKIVFPVEKEIPNRQNYQLERKIYPNINKNDKTNKIDNKYKYFYTTTKIQ